MQKLVVILLFSIFLLGLGHELNYNNEELQGMEEDQIIFSRQQFRQVRSAGGEVPVEGSGEEPEPSMPNSVETARRKRGAEAAKDVSSASSEEIEGSGEAEPPLKQAESVQKPNRTEGTVVKRLKKRTVEQQKQVAEGSGEEGA